MKTVLITGASGFIGSHIAEELLKQKFNVVALKRSTSDLWRCEEFKNKIKWIECDNLLDAENEILNFKPEILIHAAWNGTSVIDRENWEMQEKNLTFLIDLLKIVKKTKISKIIALGSQAEYGYYEGTIDEDYPCNPIIAYGVIKLCALFLLKIFAKQNNIDWYWIRIFSIYGPKEQDNKLIPLVIKNLSEKNKMEFPPSEQRGDYLFVKDFSKGILNVVKSKKVMSQIFNFSSGDNIKIKDILSILENKISPKEKLLEIGKLPYRNSQIMHMEGDSTHFFKLFNFTLSYDIYDGLNETIEYYLRNKNNE